MTVEAVSAVLLLVLVDDGEAAAVDFLNHADRDECLRVNVEDEFFYAVHVGQGGDAVDHLHFLLQESGGSVQQGCADAEVQQLIQNFVRLAGVDLELDQAVAHEDDFLGYCGVDKHDQDGENQICDGRIEELQQEDDGILDVHDRPDFGADFFVQDQREDVATAHASSGPEDDASPMPISVPPAMAAISGSSTRLAFLNPMRVNSARNIG